MRLFILLLFFALFLGCLQAVTRETKASISNINITADDVGSVSNEPVSIDDFSYTEDFNFSNFDDVFYSINNSSENFTDQNFNDSGLQVYYFYSPACPFCSSIKPEIDRIESNYNSSIKILRYNVYVQDDLDTYNNFTTIFNTSRTVPIIFVNKTYLSGLFDINRSLESLIINSTNLNITKNFNSSNKNVVQ